MFFCWVLQRNLKVLPDTLAKEPFRVKDSFSADSTKAQPGVGSKITINYIQSNIDFFSTSMQKAITYSIYR